MDYKLIEKILASNHKIYAGVAAIFYSISLLFLKESWMAIFAGLGTVTVLFLWLPNYVFRHEKQPEEKAEGEL